jgi:hypothetical protein
MTMASKAFKVSRGARAPIPSAGWRAIAAPKWLGGLGVRMTLAALVAAGAVTAAWYGSSTRVPIPPPRPQMAAAPVRPIVPPTPIVAMTPVPAPAIENATMSPAQETAFNGWLIGAYRQCWTAPKTPPDGETYLPKIRIAFKADGALAGAPRLINPPSDPAWRPQADAALRAVKSCDPLRVPDKYAAYYRQWKTRTVYFDPTAR